MILVSHRYEGNLSKVNESDDVANQEGSLAVPGPCWFSHDVTKLLTKKLSIFLSFHLHEVLKYPTTFIYTTFRFERVIRFAIEDASIPMLLRDVAFSWRPGKLSSGLKTSNVFKVCNLNIPFLRINTTLMFVSSLSDELTHL